jgi:hypothetical protein
MNIVSGLLTMCRDTVIVACCSRWIHGLDTALDMGQP